MDLLRERLGHMPIIAILRGISPAEAGWAFDALVAAGIRIIEVPLNSPQALDSIRLLVQRATGEVLIGAGTVLAADDARAVASLGAKLVVAPNCDPAVIQCARELGMATLPGVATPTEAFTALKAGASGLKMFPGEMLPPKAVRAWRAVMPPGALLLPVGGITPDNMADYVAASANGFGVGSNLYKPGVSFEQLDRQARLFVARYRQIKSLT